VLDRQAPRPACLPFFDVFYHDDMKQPLNIWQWRERARSRLPRLVFDYLDGGAEDERCLRRNRAALEALELRPAVLNDVSSIDLSVEIFGQRFELPVATD
jgi:(S)-mandelate dehydrogenase